MKIIAKAIQGEELQEMAAGLFGNIVKAVVDIERELLAVDAELHSDLEALLLEDGSQQRNLWGINLYPQLAENEFIEFDFLINIRPSRGNTSRGVENAGTRQKIIAVVKKRITR